MSLVKGVNKTLIDAGTILAPGLFDGRVKVIVDTYEASTLANPSTITMGGRFTKGAVVLFGILIYDSLGGSTTLDVGDAENTTRYISAKNTSSAGVGINDEVDGIAYTTDETDSSNLDTQILITAGGSGTLSGTIRLVVLFTND